MSPRWCRQAGLPSSSSSKPGSSPQLLSPGLLAGAHASLAWVRLCLEDGHFPGSPPHPSLLCWTASPRGPLVSDAAENRVRPAPGGSQPPSPPFSWTPAWGDKAGLGGGGWMAGCRSGCADVEGGILPLWLGVRVPKACFPHVTFMSPAGEVGGGGTRHPAEGQDLKALGGKVGSRVSGQPAGVNRGLRAVCAEPVRWSSGPLLTGPVSPTASSVGSSGPSSTHMASALRSKAVRPLDGDRPCVIISTTKYPGHDG